MSLIVVGINHTTAPISVREKLAIGDHELGRALDSLCRSDSIVEGAILSTCNRTEAYALVDSQVRDPEDLLGDFLAGWHGLRRHEFDGHLYCYRDSAVAGHLFAVASGIDSMIVGEPDIQRQVKTALEAAQTARTAGTLLNRLFQDALVAGKRVRTETGIARGSFSVGGAAAEFASQIFGDSLAGRTVLVLGAGKMSEVTARHLAERGAPSLLVANRTFERAQQIAEQFGGRAHHYDDLPSLLATADIVVCSTAAPHPVITRAMMKDVVRARRSRELFLIDIAVPRDVEASVADLDNVYICNIDDLSQMVSGARETRAAEIERARALIDEGAQEYLRWWRSLEVAPLIVAVREKLAAARLAELARLRARLSGLSDKDWRAIEAGFEALTNKIAHPATMAIKAHAQDDSDPGSLDAIRNAFGLTQDEPVAEETPAERAKPREAQT